MNLIPTPEQQRAIDLFASGKSLKVNAFAGTGKTATLALLAGSTRRPGIYLAFNRSTADEAATKFPWSVNCKTTHQLAWRATPDQYRVSDKMTANLNAYRVSKFFNLSGVAFSDGTVLKPVSRGALILDTLRSFQQSDDSELKIEHVPLYGKLHGLEKNDRVAMQEYSLAFAQKLWELMLDPTHELPLGHSGYYKLWALSNPVIPGNYILVDEAQDTNPAMLGVLRQQTTQLIYVGDKYQQIYEWRGAINAMELMQTEQEAVLTQSFRFGQKVADAATMLLRWLDDPNTIIGNPQINSQLSLGASPDAVLCRTNAGVIAHALDCLSQGKKPHIVGGSSELIRLLKCVSELKEGRQVEHSDFFGFSSWAEVQEFAGSDEGAHLKSFVDIVERFGEVTLMGSLGATAEREDDSDVTISTVHKAKGRQWDQVYLYSDFPIYVEKMIQSGRMNRPELRLFYVALTRGRFGIHIPDYLHPLFDPYAIESFRTAQLLKATQGVHYNDPL